jgi:hypothetical protein
VEQRKDIRFHYLGQVYELTGGKEKFLDYRGVGARLGLDDQSAFKIAQYLGDEGLLRFRSSTSLLTITNTGISEIKASLSGPNEDSSHFRPARVVQAAQPDEQPIREGATTAPGDSGFSPAQTTELREIIMSIRMSMGQLQLGQEELNMDADIRTIEAQLSSSRPRRRILEDALDSMRGILGAVPEPASMPFLVGRMAALSRAATTPSVA